MEQQQMSRQEAVEPKAAESLSALMDGEVHDADEVARACRAWREDAASRESWHRYHLIGDVLRSDDLASSGARDADFLARLRTRLEAEPVVLAPSPRPPRARRWRWAGPAAVAAGFVAVAGVLVVTRAPQDDALPGGAAVAGARAPAEVRAVSATPATPAPVEADEIVASGKMLRDARLDRYLEAHHQFGGGLSLARRAAVDASQR